ncbi:60S ribosomal protein L8 [Platanthera guangdongensis]|uniref:60S ribosomal protein L8 n=1 Tax=Platanthera guangdongensis TaxID=2320717 RepID=A0ABR2LNI3_9ASPA
MSRNDRSGRRRRQNGETAPQGRQRLPQVSCEEKLLAQGPGRRHESRGASPWRRKPPAHWPRLHCSPRCPTRQKVGLIAARRTGRLRGQAAATASKAEKGS